MRLHSFLLLAMAALCTAAANLCLRAGLLRAGGFDPGRYPLGRQILLLVAQPTFVVGFLLYGAAAVIWFRILSVIEVSVGYPVLVSLTFLLVTLGSLVFFNEQVSLQKVIGLGVILTGIQLVARA